MKEELIKVLNNKLDDINGDIDSLVELNEKILKEENDLSYIVGILDLFKENNEDNIMNFTKLARTDFNKVLDILGGDIKEVFSSPSCNYDGLVYLINGINDGVSLTLTDEQKNAILYLIEKLTGKKEEHEAAIEGFNLVKNRYSIKDVDELKSKKEKYLVVLGQLDNKKYVRDTNLLQEAIDFSSLTPEKTIAVLKYLLEYNATVYNEKTDVEDKKDENNETLEKSIEQDNSITIEPIDNNPISLENYENSNVEKENEQEEKEYQEFHFNDVVKDEFTNFSPLSFYNYEDEEKEQEDITRDDNIGYVPTFENELDENIDYTVENDETNMEEKELPVKTNNDYEDDEVKEISFNNDEKVSTGDLHQLLGKYDIKEDNTYINELVVGDVKNYEDVLNTLEEENILDSFKNNSRLLVETLLYSNSDVIKKILKIIKEDLSVDEEDYKITTKIVIDTIPSIFVVQDGNFDNFIQNVDTFKELELNLINLFDFSKEIFVASHDTIINNLEIVKKYDINITYQNAKYLLLLEDIGDRIDYYVESVYLDKEKNETFDGIEYINLYTTKLNTVTDETIKRLRYCSENGKRIFGSKPKSLTGDITNLKVNSLDITGDYLSKFFNNEFAILTGDEVREYTKLIHNSSNVGNYDDELDVLDKYRDGLRYVIEGINISYNKVLRNYSILRSYGIDTKKALHFAVCYNLVITKDEYDKLKNILNEIGGGR